MTPDILEKEAKYLIAIEYWLQPILKQNHYMQAVS